MIYKNKNNKNKNNKINKNNNKKNKNNTNINILKKTLKKKLKKTKNKLLNPAASHLFSWKNIITHVYIKSYEYLFTYTHAYISI